MKKLKYFFVLVLILPAIWVSCDDEPVPPKEENGTTQDTNILITDEFGNVLGGDTTDWCFEIAAFPRFGPSYPNPCSSTFTIRYGAAVAETIKIYFLKPNNDSIVVFRGTAQAGFNEYIIDVSTYNFTNTFQRLYVQSQNLTTSDSCKNYGDIKFEP